MEKIPSVSQTEDQQRPSSCLLMLSLDAMHSLTHSAPPAAAVPVPVAVPVQLWNVLVGLAERKVSHLEDWKVFVAPRGSRWFCEWSVSWWTLVWW
mmetsp:Transcript_23746/g.46654  ORF Transcript_23746/g.46654 Transcript_23746/m.46654 type:complete len:95 (-) Transcript_23746:823-1107(-)